jgi:ABC-type Zn uptake system ZnuABC Zn-binding protein ZnuA
LRDAQVALAKLAFCCWVLLATLAQAQVRIVATTAELESLASAVGGDSISITHLIPAGQDAESFQPRPQDLSRLRDASAIIRVGVDYDLWLDRMLAQLVNPIVIDASVDVALLDVRAGGIGPGDGHAHGRGNPHYWLDPANAEMITGTILEALMKLDPSNAKRYEANRLAFLSLLHSKIPQWTRALQQAPAIIAYHDTWPYFARRFRLHIVGIIEMKPGVPPSPSHLAQLAGEHAGAIIREPHEPRRDADFLAAKTGAKVAILTSTIGAIPEVRDYLSLIDYNVRALSHSREGGNPVQ